VKILLKAILIASVAVLLLNSSLLAAQSSKGKGGNGFPPGTHFNLNVIAKWSERESGNFTCPAVEDYIKYETSDGTSCVPISDVDENCLAVPGNVIFIPREGSEDQRIDVVSGGKGKKATAIIDTDKLQVTDWCTEAFPNDGDVDDSAAAFYLPDNESGYEVYARLVGKPRKKKDGPYSSLTLIPDIESVSTDCTAFVDDGEGGLVVDPTQTEPCQLLHIGSFSSDGVEVLRSGDGSSTGTTKGKGANKAVPVTALFQFTGHVCLRPEPLFYESIGDNGVDTSGFCLDAINGCTEITLCCTEDTNLDGLFDNCGYLDPFDDPTNNDTLTLGDGFVCDDTELLSQWSVDCQGPFVNEWTFNISDIVDYFLTVQNNGGYVLQLRFYPNPK